MRRIMTRRIVFILAGIPFTFGLLASPSPQQNEKSEQKEKTPPFRWLDPAGESVAMRFETRRLDKISLAGQYGSASEAEKETTPLGENGTRTTIRVYDRDANGNRTLVETVVEEVRNLPGDRTQAVRTVSRRDANNRMPVVRRYTQETSPAGTGAFHTKLTVFLPGSSGTLVPAEQVIQEERSKAQNEIEIDRTQLIPGASGRLQPNERRISSIRGPAGQTSTDEVVYRYDPGGNARIDQRMISKEWQDPQGRDNREITNYRADLSGRMNLDGRTRITSTSQPDGARQTVQVTEQQNPVAPSEGLRLIERVTEFARPAGAEREVHVQTPDANGTLRTVYFQRTSEIK